MTAKRQPAVYTHTCDRCAATVETADGDARGAGWLYFTLPANSSPTSATDLCADCVAAFVAFMKGEALQGVSR